MVHDATSEYVVVNGAKPEQTLVLFELARSKRWQTQNSPLDESGFGLLGKENMTKNG